MSNDFSTTERIQRLLAHARRAEEAGRSGVARNLRRMALDLRPARVPRREF
jgi:hypothetical protein